MGARDDVNIFERAIAAVAPGYALKRARNRLALRAYEAASKGRRTDGWRTAGTSANSETRSGLIVSRNRARDLVRNNPYAARAVSIIETNMVGYGIRTTPQSANKKTMRPLQKSWLAWAETRDCDVTGKLNMYGLQGLAARTVVESGESLIRRVWRRPAFKGQIPFQIQVLEPDFIDSSKDGKSGSNIIVQGKEYDSIGRCVAYWLFPAHPGDGTGTAQSVRTPAEDIEHIYREDRPGQVRGVTWLAPIVIRLRDFDEYEDAQLVRQKIAACFAGFVHDSDGAEGTAQGDTAGDGLIEKFEPGMIERLGPGQQITFASPPLVQGYSEYASVTLHAIASGIGVPYEALTGDYSEVNFTSGRMGRSDFHAQLDAWQWNMFIPKFCEPVFAWFVQAAILAGIKADGATARYTPPRRNLVDPTREIPALIKAVRGGGETIFGMIRSMGYDPEDFLAEIAEGNAMLDKLGLTLDSDPRRVSAAGLTQARPPGSEIPGDGSVDDGDSKSAKKDEVID
jgi:lambda family phage portal protein